MADTVVLVNKGLEIITDRIKGAGGSEPKYLGFGIGINTATATDTVLQTPSGEARVNGTSTQETTNTTKDTYQVNGTIICTGTTKAITEVGLFDASTNGNMFMRATFSPINLNPGDGISFTIKTVHSRA